MAEVNNSFPVLCYHDRAPSLDKGWTSCCPNQVAWRQGGYCPVLTCPHGGALSKGQNWVPAG